MNRFQKIGFWGGTGLFILTLIYGVWSHSSGNQVSMVAILLLMAGWWISEAIPIPVTSLLPIALFPALGIMKTAEVTVSYGHHIIFLFLGGFILARAIEKWNLHKRISLNIILMFGTAPNRIILGFMAATAFLSMWVSNTATTMMMLPIAMSVLAGLTSEETQEPGSTDISTALLLGIAFAASIGGLGTLIGTPPNALLAAIVEQQFGQHISFLQWMTLGVPFAILFLIIAWYLLTRFIFKTGTAGVSIDQSILRARLNELGPINAAGKRTAIVFSLVAFAWLGRGFLHFTMINDSSIAITGAVLLFVLPSGDKQDRFLMDWRTAASIPWGVLLLFGGGLALAKGLKATGLVKTISSLLADIHTTAPVILVLLVALAGILLTELTSNTATASLLIPVAGSTAVALHLHPFLLMIPVCVATSYAFMLPVATPPNAVVFGSGQITIPQMARAGIWLNLAGSLLILFFTLIVMPAIWGIDLTTLPLWAQ